MICFPFSVLGAVLSVLLADEQYSWCLKIVSNERYLTSKLRFKEQSGHMVRNADTSMLISYTITQNGYFKLITLSCQ